MSEQTVILTGQLRRWKEHFSDHRLAGKVFVILQEDWERCETEACWSFLVEGREEWHFEESILLDSEILHEAR